LQPGNAIRFLLVWHFRAGVYEILFISAAPFTLYRTIFSGWTIMEIDVTKPRNQVDDVLDVLASAQPSNLVDLQDLMNEAYAFLDTLTIAMSQSLAALSKAESDVQQAQIQKQFEEIRKQMEANKSNLFLKIFMPLLMALGIIFLMVAPMDPMTKGILVGLLLTLLADNVMSAATGESFMKSFFEKIAQGNESVANWLAITFEAVVMLLSLLASFGAGSGTVSARIASVSARVSALAVKLSDLGIRVSKGAIESVRNLGVALSKLGAEDIHHLESALETANASIQAKRGTLAAMVEKLAENPALKALREKVLSQKGSEVIQRLCDATLLLSGMVVGSLSIDKAMVQMQLAKITRELEILDAHADYLKELRDAFLDHLGKTDDLRTQFGEQLDSAIQVWRQA
jgi:hypothetical protein